MPALLRHALFLALCTWAPTLFAQAADPEVAEWPIARDVVDVNKDGLPSVWTFVPGVVHSPREAATAVAKTLSTPLPSGTSPVTFELLRTHNERHHRYQLYGAGGYAVLGAQLNVHEDPSGALRGNGAFVLPRQLGEAPAIAIDARKARGIAERAAGSARLRDAATLEATVPYWVPRDLDFARAEYVLAHRVDVYSLAPLDRHYAYVDVATGEIVARQERLHSTEEPGTCDTRYAGRQSFTTDRRDDGSYRLYQETTRNTVMHTRNAENGDGFSWSEFTDDDNDWTGTNAAQDEVARDAHWGMERYHDLLTEYFDERSIDDDGFDMIANVHVDFNFANAFWDGQTTNYGDGDPGSIIASPLTAIDVVAHEFTHGLTEFSAGLIYNGESGALNESFSDMFGVATRFYARPDQLGNYAIGDQMDPQGVGFRSLEDPNLQENPGTYGGDFWVDGAGVHTNSGVGNHWFYLLAEGETGTNELGTAYSVTGIGWEDALRVAHATLTDYLTPASTYAEAAALSVEAAGVLFGACDMRTAQVAEAWKAVGRPTPSLAQGISFSVDQTRICELGDPVAFSALADAGTATWDFGDGTTGNGLSASHVYGPGTYTVTLYASDCDGVRDTITRPNLITVDQDNPACDTLLLEPSGTRTETRCAGVLVDPGGDDNYPNGASTEAVIMSPGGGGNGFRLTVASFALESGWDYLTIESIAGGQRALVGNYTGSELVAGDELTLPGEGFAVTFTSDGSVTFAGFEIAFESLGGSAPVEAGMAVAQPAVTIYEPVRIEFTGTGQEATYDFGDGSVANFAATAPATHRYAQAGTYTVRQYVAGCTNRDTATAQVSVAAGSRACAAADTAYLTLQLGDTALVEYAVRNCGSRPLWLDAASGLTFSGPVPVAVGAELNVGVPVRSLDWGVGVHRFGESLQTNDDTRAGGILELPVALTVVGRPFGEFAPSVLDLGRVYTNRAVAAATTLRSVGTDVLEVAGIAVRGDGLTQDLPQAARLDVGEELPLEISKQSSVVGAFADEITYATNGGDLVLSVVGEVVAAALIGVDETPLVDTLVLGEVKTYTVPVASEGVLALELQSNAGIGAWFTHASSDRDVPAGQTAELEFTANATGLATGDYESAIILRSNDPERATVVIPVMVYVLGLPAAAIANDGATVCGATVDFGNDASDDARTFTWTFGDGATSTQRSPSHTYAASGTYEVTLEACNDAGCDVATAQVTVELDCRQVTLDPNAPATVTGCVGQLLDSGGEDEGYGNDEYAVTTITSDDGRVIELTPVFFETETNYDYLRVYDGTTTSAPFLAEWHGALTGAPAVRSSQPSITVEWDSDFSVTRSGFEVVWACVDPSDASAELARAVRLYPNPAHEAFGLDLPSGQAFALTLVDALGRTALTQSVRDGARVALAGLPAGVYQVVLAGERDGSRVVRRVVVE